MCILSLGSTAEITESFSQTDKGQNQSSTSNKPDLVDNLELAVFAGCNTAKNTGTRKNLPDAAVDAGAEIAIGFKDTVFTYKIGPWLKCFFEGYYEYGYNTQNAVYYASNESEYDIDDICYISNN